MESRSRRSTKDKDHDYFMKVVLVGNSAVGKSSLMLRFADNQFQSNYVNTIGVDFRFKIVTVDGARVKIQIWDTAGQEKFRTMTSTYYKSSDAVVVVYDMTEEKSYREIENYWVDEISQHVDNVIPVVLANKSDLKSRQQVDSAAARELVIAGSRVVFFEVSAKEDSNVWEAFEEMARRFIEKKKEKRKMRREMNEVSSSNFMKKDAKGSSIAHEEEEVSVTDPSDIYNLHAQLSSGASRPKEGEETGCKC